MNPNRREKKRIAALDEIKSTAWKQIGEQGATSLSLRAIAREMGMTAPGLYRYYKDRDALVTALLIDAFASFTSNLETARDACAQDDHIGRFRGICKAYFQWAAEYPQKYMLLFGTPIQGYMFAEELGSVAQKSFLVLQGVIGEAHASGKLNGEVTALRLPTRLKSQYETLKKMGMPYSGMVTQLALSVWAIVHGMSSLFLYNYLNGFLQGNVETFIDFEIEKMIKTFGIG